MDEWVSACDSGTCVEVKWLKACSDGSCVEVAHDGGRVLVRDGKLGDESPVLEYGAEEWGEVLNSVRLGFLPHWGQPDTSHRSVDGGVVWVNGDVAGGPSLSFTAEEWDSFVEGVRAGRFSPEVPA